MTFSDKYLRLCFFFANLNWTATFRNHSFSFWPLNRDDSNASFIRRLNKFGPIEACSLLLWLCYWCCSCRERSYLNSWPSLWFHLSIGIGKILSCPKWLLHMGLFTQSHLSETSSIAKCLSQASKPFDSFIEFCFRCLWVTIQRLITFQCWGHCWYFTIIWGKLSDYFAWVKAANFSRSKSTCILWIASEMFLLRFDWSNCL